MDKKTILVGVIMGSTSDWETMRHAHEVLDVLGMAHEYKVVSIRCVRHLSELIFSNRPITKH